MIRGNLGILGDNDSAGNDITVTETAPGAFTVTGNNGTTINGKTDVYNSSDDGLVGGSTGGRVLIGLGTGPDKLTYNGTGVTSLKALYVTSGAGSDTVNLTNVRAHEVAVGQATVTLPAILNLSPAIFKAAAPADLGNDNVIVSAHPSGSGNVSINLGTGADGAGVSGKFWGDVSVKGYGGGDTVLVHAAQIGQGLAVSNTAGAAGNTVTLNNNFIGRGASVFNAGSGGSTVTVSNTLVGKTLIVTNASTASLTPQFSEISAVGVTAAGGITFIGGAGPDIFSILASNTGPVRINSANGNTSATLTSVNATSVQYNGGSGIDLLEFEGLKVAGDVNAQLGLGGSDIKVRGSRVGGDLSVFAAAGLALDTVAIETSEVFGDTFISLGAGNDTVTANSVQFYGNTTALLGAGDDKFSLLNTLNTSAPTSLYGNLKVITGAGSDKVFAANDAEVGTANERVELFGSISGDFFAGTDVAFAGVNAFQIGADNFFDH